MTTDTQAAAEDRHLTFTEEDFALLSADEREAAAAERAEAETEGKEEAEAAKAAEDEAAAKAREQEEAREAAERRARENEEAALAAERRAAEAQSRVQAAEIDEIKRQQAALKSQWSDGDLSDAEYQEQLTATTRKMVEAEMAIEAAKRRETEQAEAANDAWYRAADQYVAENGAIAQGPAYDAWARHVQAIDGNPDYAAMPDTEKFRLAHEFVAVAARARGTPIDGPKATTPPPEAPPKADPAAEGKSPQRAEAPPTLAHVPAADHTGQDDGRNAALDRVVMSGDAFAAEDALMSLPAADRERYIRS